MRISCRAPDLKRRAQIDHTPHHRRNVLATATTVSIVAVEVVATIRANDVAGVGTGVGAGVGAHGDLADVELEAFTYNVSPGSFSLSYTIKAAHEPLNTLVYSAPVALNMVAFSLGGEQDVAVQGAPDVLNGSSQSCVSHI